MKGKKKSIWIAILFCWQVMAMAAISVQVTPSTVQVGQSFRLILTLDNPKSAGIPNLTPLQKDFKIVGTERNMVYSVINGQAQATGQWSVILIPKKTGILAIPPLQIGQEQSIGSSIEVTAGPTTSLNDDEDRAEDEVLIETEINQQELFLNQQAIYTVKLYNSQRLMDAEYVPPNVEDALLVPLGGGKRYQKFLNGRSYMVEEQQYAVFPQKSGNLKIEPPTFNALVFDTVPRRISVHGKTVEAKVKPIPADYKGKYWLPAKQVALTAVYDQLDKTIKEGETLVRTVTLQAAGVPAQLLPTLEFNSTDHYRTYPEKPELKNTARQQDLIGRADIKVTYVFNKAGKITIPELQVPWFNTETGKEEIATLPAHTIQVEGGEPSAAKQNISATSSSVSKENEQKSRAPSMVKVNESTNSLAWWIAGGFALAWLITLFLWLGRHKSFNRGKDKQQALKALQQACKNGNPKQAQAALLRWAALQWPDLELINLQQIARQTHDTDLKKELSLLSQAIYSHGNATWQGDALWRNMVAYLHMKPGVKSKRNELPPINPG